MAEQWTSDLAAVRPAQYDVSEAPDDLARMEIEDIRKEEAAENVRESRWRRKQRQIWAERVYFVALAWFAVSLGAVILRGFWPQTFYVSDAVQIALVSGGTVNVLGVVAIIVRHLFPANRWIVQSFDLGVDHAELRLLNDDGVLYLKESIDLAPLDDDAVEAWLNRCLREAAGARLKIDRDSAR